jgi:CRP-like cAMP-binding protein
MSSETVAQGLRLAHFLRGLSDTDLSHLSARLPLASFHAGDILLNLGDPLEAVFLILTGDVELTAYDSHGDSRLLTRLSAGSIAGLLEFFAGKSIQVRATASTDVSALRWDRSDLAEFLSAHPHALASLRLAAASQRLAYHLNLDWLNEGEVVVGLARKHVVKLVVGEILPALVLTGGIGLGVWASTTGSGLLMALAGLVGLLGAAYAVWQWIDWQNDYYVVTNRRVVRLEKIVALYDSRQETPLHQVLSVSVSTDAISRLLGYGDVLIRTYTGQIVFPTVGLPKRLAAMIEEQWRRQQMVQKATDREDVERAVRDVLKPTPDAEAPPPSEEASTDEPTPSDPEHAPQLGLDHWGFQLRFESQGVVTYRKHWAVLLGHIGLPSLLILLVVGLAGAGLGGLLDLRSPWTALQYAGLALIPLGLWWLYQYVDWANDIYQVTPTHIIDVYKRPLGRELRKVAPLENLLSTEVDRRGLIGILLNFGDVTANVGTEVLDFEGVFNPSAVQQDVVRAQEAFLAQRREADRKQRQDEMVEWLSVYHEQVSNPDNDEATPKDQDDYP